MNEPIPEAPLSELLVRAAAFAAERHRSQRRKDDAATPYINHPLQVAELLVSANICDAALLAAAMLHDTVEDTATSFAEIESAFGAEVCGLVAEVTDDKSLPKQRRKELQIEHAPHKSPRAKQLKIADKICNIRDLSDISPVGWDRERKAEYLRWAEAVVAGCEGINDWLDEQFRLAVTAKRRELGFS
ncbi:MAG: bifunctional (p)ppGpp synthetase/guanosine-3',5'-bis(diphosphate) 3'-pyrophosphohydrolase [Planctomycetales bacterium]|nr:bifunctional (p)ppGpp synthetase/guanosine-3',5'-bis(diphosphate) 3'-pyrophosphohydrolase [Planctomycetales bacterium]